MKRLINSKEAAWRIQEIVRKSEGCEHFEGVSITNATSPNWKAYCVQHGPNAFADCYTKMVQAAEEVRREFDLTDAIKLTYPLPLKPHAVHNKPIIETLADAEDFLTTHAAAITNTSVWVAVSRAIDDAKKAPHDHAVLLRATKGMHDMLQFYEMIEV